MHVAATSRTVHDTMGENGEYCKKNDSTTNHQRVDD